MKGNTNLMVCRIKWKEEHLRAIAFTVFQQIYGGCSLCWLLLIRLNIRLLANDLSYVIVITATVKLLSVWGMREPPGLKTENKALCPLYFDHIILKKWMSPAQRELLSRHNNSQTHFTAAIPSASLSTLLLAVSGNVAQHHQMTLYNRPRKLITPW